MVGRVGEDLLWDRPRCPRCKAHNELPVDPRDTLCKPWSSPLGLLALSSKHLVGHPPKDRDKENSRLGFLWWRHRRTQPRTRRNGHQQCCVHTCTHPFQNHMCPSVHYKSRADICRMDHQALIPCGNLTCSADSGDPRSLADMSISLPSPLGSLGSLELLSLTPPGQDSPFLQQHSCL